MLTRITSLIHKSLILIVVAGLMFSSLGLETQPARAQAVPSATPTPPPFTPTVAPTPDVLSSLDFSAAGMGTLYRAHVTLKHAKDPQRIQSQGATILQSSGGVAVVQATAEQLETLARLGFEPTQIDSVDYMLTVQSLSGGEIQSLADVTTSPNEMMALASVDSDSDGLTDTEEAWWCTDPQDENSDFAGPSSASDPNDGQEVADILKGITSYGPPFAMWPNFTPYHANGTCQDGDFDGVPDNAELYMIGTSPQRESSDLDKFDDGQELFGVTFCPASSGPCGYGILPRAEDAAFVSANMPAWVKAPGNSPFVAAFPQPKVEVVPSSLKLTQVTVITNTKGTTVGTEKTYGTSSTKGTSASQSDTTTWNEWDETAISIPNYPNAQELNPQLVT